MVPSKRQDCLILEVAVDWRLQCVVAPGGSNNEDIQSRFGRVPVAVDGLILKTSKMQQKLPEDQKTCKSISPVISESQQADSAVYFCALSEPRHILSERNAGWLDHFTVTSAFLLVENQEPLGDSVEMNSSPGLVAAVLLVLGQTHGDSVTQQEGQVTVSAGDSLNVSCTFSASGSLTLFWYVQYPGEGLQLLLRALTSNKKEKKEGFEATYRKDSNSFHLEKTSVQESDSAVYYCALGDTVTETAGGAERKLSSSRGLAAECL
ncbi:uncharacterized protein LOC119238019 [Talpa occidentalis]|uniref:uncharacterized protein LOC119238019 n=1 Tax=Talpa occidentalis TaxID=50954 RepID=UPI0023F8F9CB|nr:uncharacterized protein LOC119238019 [Talpa occidentalis]